jgi:hypothetical protein
MGVKLHAFFDLGTRWKWVVSFMPWLLYPQRQSPWYPLDRRLGGPQSWSGYGVEEKNTQPPLGFESWSSDHPTCSQSLYQLNFPVSSHPENTNFSLKCIKLAHCNRWQKYRIVHGISVLIKWCSHVCLKVHISVKWFFCKKKNNNIGLIICAVEQHYSLESKDIIHIFKSLLKLKWLQSNILLKLQYMHICVRINF